MIIKSGKQCSSALKVNSIGASEYSLSFLSKLFKAFMRCRNNNIYPDERTNEPTDGTAYKHNAFAVIAGGRGDDDIISAFNNVTD